MLFFISLEILSLEKIVVRGIKMGYMNKDFPPNPHRKQRISWSLILTIIVFTGLLVVANIFPETNTSPNHVTNEKVQNQPNNDVGNIINTSVQVDVSTQITDVVEEVTPAVVGVTNIQQETNYWHQSGEIEAGTGSGVIYKLEDGTAYVVTNHHVIQGADTVEVVLHDETSIPAEIVGSDIFTDLAVLRMDGSEIGKVIEIGSSANVKVGEPAVAIGNPLGHMFSSTVTQGVISGKERTIPQDFDQDGRADWQAEVIQTDAAINPGNSGGALINISGQLIGINSMKINEEAVEGIGFSIPVDYAMPVIHELESKGRMSRPYLGVEIYSLDEVPQAEWKNTLRLPNDVNGGVYVWSVERLSPADQVGLQQLDVNMIDLRRILYHEKEIGEKVTLTYFRDGEKRQTELILGSQ